MENNSKQVVIGIRGKAMQARTSSIVFIVAGAFLILMGLGISAFAFSTGPEGFAPGFALLAVFGLFGGLIIFLGVWSLNYVLVNDRDLDKPVLVYDLDKDIFIGYDVRHQNKEVIIKNGNILAIKGSAMWTGRELFINYKTEEGKNRRVSLGFCRNIDNNAFRNKLNQYHNKML